MPRDHAPRHASLPRAVALTIAALVLVPASAHGYAAEGRAWPKRTITVHDASPYRFAVKQAVRSWNRSGVRVRFRRTASRRAHVLISSPGGRRGTDGGGCAGFAQLGYVPGRQARVSMAPRCADDLLTATTIAHELGHVLGLGHENRRCALMNPVLANGAPNRCTEAPPWSGSWRCRVLEPDDLRGAIRLYGGRARVVRPSRCPIFAAPAAVTDVTAVVAGGAGEVRFTAPPAPRRLARVAGASPQIRPVVQRDRDACAAPHPALRDEPVGALRWSAPFTYRDFEPLEAGRWCYTVWLEDTLGRRSPPRTAMVDVAPPDEPAYDAPQSGPYTDEAYTDEPGP